MFLYVGLGAVALQGGLAAILVLLLSEALTEGDTFGHPVLLALAVPLTLTLSITLVGHLGFLEHHASQLEAAGKNLRLFRKLQKLLMKIAEYLP